MDNNVPLSCVLAENRYYFKSWPDPLFAMGYLANALSLFLAGFTQSLWFHGRTPKQFEAAMPLIGRLRPAAPHIRFVFTTNGLTSYEWVKARFPTDTVFPAPLDQKFMAARFFSSIAPKIFFFIESDLGVSPHILLKAAQNNVPVIAVNVSKNHKEPATSFAAHRLSGTKIALACVQDKSAAAMLHQLGIVVEKIAITGDLYFDFISPVATASQDYLRIQLGLKSESPVVIAERIQPLETRMLANVFQNVKRIHPTAVLLLEPSNRHKIPETIIVFKQNSLNVCHWSKAMETNDKDVILFDRPRDVGGFYKIATCVVAGASFFGTPHPINPIVPVLNGKPVLYGPRLPATGHLAPQFIKRQAALQVSPATLYSEIIRIIDSSGHSAEFIANAKSIIEENQGAAEKAYRAIEPLLPRVPELPLAHASWRVDSLRDRLGKSSLWERLSKPLKRSRINDWDALNTRIGNPETILCLGNGPSSEDPQVLETRYDCLFRINWRWKSRRLFTNPSVVFVGHPQTVHKLSSCVFAFWNIELESSMLLRHFITRGFKRIEYFTVERLSPIIQDHKWPARPTNGALMIVAAAALEPKRMVIAGIDLFRHPDGKYPGDLRSSNQYSQPHHPDTELDIMRCALKTYSGKLDIIGAPLQAALQDFL